MKQTVEDAAIESCVMDKSIYNDKYQPYYLDGFKAGAEWQARQSPWISAKERLPEYERQVIVLDRQKQDVYFNHRSNNPEVLKDKNGWCSFGDSDITHWLPIPTFDQILEANKDVLQRIKEKGD